MLMCMLKDKNNNPVIQLTLTHPPREQFAHIHIFPRIHQQVEIQQEQSQIPYFPKVQNVPYGIKIKTKILDGSRIER